MFSYSRMRHETKFGAQNLGTRKRRPAWRFLSRRPLQSAKWTGHYSPPTTVFPARHHFRLRLKYIFFNYSVRLSVIFYFVPLPEVRVFCGHSWPKHIACRVILLPKTDRRSTKCVAQTLLGFRPKYFRAQYKPHTIIFYHNDNKYNKILPMLDVGILMVRGWADAGWLTPWQIIIFSNFFFVFAH